MLFVRVLDCLAHVLAQPGPAISFLFHPEVDLTEKVTRETRDNISCRIKRIVRKLRLFPDQCYELVLKNQQKDRASSDNVVRDVALNNIRNIVSNNVQLLIVDLSTYLGLDKLNEILAAVKESLESNKQYKKETMDKLREIDAGIKDINSRMAKLESINEVAEIKKYLLEVNAAIFKVKTLVNIISQA
uniref:Putative secreted protein n=1 Tax=Ixodes ricinus TaxID=34613 RepID=V5GQJ2_IXORI